jgi:hypothetical protein
MPYLQGMEGHFIPGVEAKLNALITETGRLADAFVQDARCPFHTYTVSSSAFCHSGEACPALDTGAGTQGASAMGPECPLQPALM